MAGKPDPRRRPPTDRGPRINHQIRIRQVRVIDEDNKQLGVMETADALALAIHKTLDLVEIAPNQRPPVCRVRHTIVECAMSDKLSFSVSRE